MKKIIVGASLLLAAALYIYAQEPVGFQDVVDITPTQPEMSSAETALDTVTTTSPEKPVVSEKPAKPLFSQLTLKEQILVLKHKVDKLRKKSHEIRAKFRAVKNEVEELREEVAELKAATPAKIEEPEVLSEEIEEIED